MKKRSKKITFCAVGFALLGILFMLIALLMRLLGADIFGITFPRTDIAHIGFIVVGVIYLLIGFALYLISQDKKAMIEDNDERNQKIQSSAGFYAYAVQSVLIFTGIFLMMFMGYLNVVSMLYFSIAFVLSVAVFVAVQIYLQKKR